MQIQMNLQQTNPVNVPVYIETGKLYQNYEIAKKLTIKIYTITNKHYLDLRI